jgi:phosphatidylserine/phosphatidylglycerophosphate/cardiolipin synthase-like enzyme
MLHSFRKAFFCFCLLLATFSIESTAQIPEGWHEDSVFILPESTRKPWIEAIENAEKSIDMAAYKISDPVIIETLKKVALKGIKINLLIEPFTFEHGASDNTKSPIEAFKEFATVYTLSERFNQAHSKMIVVDKEWGLISTGNLDAESFDGILAKEVFAARDFAVPILDKKNIDEMLRMFNADIADERVTPLEKPLVYGPDFQRSTFLTLVNEATQTIDIYQQSFQDDGITKAIIGAAKAGIKVRVLMMPFPFGKDKGDQNIPNQNLMKKAGVEVGLFDKLYVHAKIVIVDNKTMYVGSGNFYGPAIDQTRELGILIENQTQIKLIKNQFEKDWAQSIVTPNLR